MWIAGRIVYTLGYSTGRPDARQRGAFMYLGLLTLLGVTCKHALRNAPIGGLLNLIYV